MWPFLVELVVRAFNNLKSWLVNIVDKACHCSNIWMYLCHKVFQQLQEVTRYRAWLKPTFLNGPNPVSFCLFSFFSHDKYSTNTVNDKSADGVLGTRTGGGMMVGADESTELCWHPLVKPYFV